MAERFHIAPDRIGVMGFSAGAHLARHVEHSSVFLAQAQDDPVSPVQNSILLHDSLRRWQIESELRLFPSGGHGWGMGKPGTQETEWPELFSTWAKQIGKW